MKRAAGLLQAIADPENLRAAFHRAQLGKGARPEVAAFRAELGEALPRMRAQLLSGRIAVGDYRYFDIRDPKPRRVCAPSFAERVLHHAIMSVVEPYLERYAIEDSYACRRGKGTKAALERAWHWSRRCRWFATMDVRKFFDSIDHGVALGLLERRIKDRAVLALFAQILASYETAPGVGVPIGSLTSQHLGNLVLGRLDHFVKDEQRVPAYLRYMDDFAVWGEDAMSVRVIVGRIRQFLRSELRLELKAPVVIGETNRGMNFLGFRVFPRGLRLTRAARKRTAGRVRSLRRRVALGAMGEAEAGRRLTAVLARLEWGNTAGLRRQWFGI